LAAPRVVDYALIKQVFDELGESAARRDTHKTLELMGRLVPEFQPPEIGVKSFFADSDPGKLDQAVSGQ